jgi:hypothetical protein
MNTSEELLESKSSGSGLESREYDRGDMLRWNHDTLYPQKFALTSPTSGDRSVGTVRSRTKATEFSFSSFYNVARNLDSVHAEFYCLQSSLKHLIILMLQVTGAARGLGRQLALNFGRRQAFVVCWDKDAENNEKTVSTLNRILLNREHVNRICLTH